MQNYLRIPFCMFWMNAGHKSSADDIDLGVLIHLKGTICAWTTLSLFSSLTTMAMAWSPTSETATNW